MSRAQQPSQDDQTVWDELAEFESELEMLVEEDTAYAEQAETLLDELADRGYR